MSNIELPSTGTDNVLQLRRNAKTVTIESVREKLSGLPEADHLTFLCDLVPQLVDIPAAQLPQWRELCLKHGLSKGDFRSILKEAKDIRDAARKAEQVEAQVRFTTAGIKTGRSADLLPGPDDPMAVVRALLERWPSTDTVSHIAWWRGDFYKFINTHWVPIKDSMVSKALYAATEHATWEHPAYGLQRWAPNRRSVGDLIHALGQGIVQRDPAVQEDRGVACTNGVLDLDTMTLLPHHPRRFNLTVLPYKYDPAATCPLWLKFLGDVLPNREEDHLFLQEWLGYLISGRTNLQKILHLYGASRSGKGTILRIIEALHGTDAVTSPTLTSLVKQFGLQPLIGKSIATMSDVKWTVRDAGEAVEILKSISGEDARNVDRKNLEEWHGTLGVRFVIAGNDIPQFRDESGALIKRMHNLKFEVSFWDREDLQLTEKLKGELGGILNWALVGLKRLDQRGYIAEPTRSCEAREEISRNTSSVAGFLQDRTEVDRTNAVPLLLDDVYSAYLDWCRSEGVRQEHVSALNSFSAKLQSAGNGAIRVERKREPGTGREGKPKRWVCGLVEAYPGALASLSQPQWRIGG